MDAHHIPTGRIFAHTDVYYALPNGRFIQGPTLRERVSDNDPKPSANYDYTRGVMSDKQADDMQYLGQYNDKSMPASTLAWWVYGMKQLSDRDMNAPDNTLTMEDLGGVNASLIIIGRINLKNPNVSWKLKDEALENFMNSATQESKNGLTSVGRALQKHAGREGSSFADIKFSGRTGNQQGLDIMNEILNSKSQLLQQSENGTVTIFDKTTGRGVNISRNGTFNGFRDMKEIKK